MSRYKYGGRPTRRLGHIAIGRGERWDKIIYRFPMTKHNYKDLRTLYSYVYSAWVTSKRWHKRNFTNYLLNHQRGLMNVDVSFLLQYGLTLQKKFKGTQAQRRRLQSAIDIMQKYI